MSDEKVIEKEGYELDMDVEPTAEEITAAEKSCGRGGVGYGKV